MKSGFTTGSCSAAAAKAATYMLLSGAIKNKIMITTPAGIDYSPEILDIKITENTVSCCVVKDSGDDPDITNGAHIYATVSLVDDLEAKVYIDGGEGVGRVTRPGLDQPIGNAAINSVPRRMIEENVREVAELLDYHGSVRVIISVLEGKELAMKTFNPRLGIEGGISIIGTSGIVEPMSVKAVLDTIKVELSQKKEEGMEIAVVSPGNYGLDFMKRQYGFDLDRAVKCSNYIGDTIDIVRNLGYKKMILVGHIGKLIKISGGIMNTHSKEADSRMELLSAAVIRAGGDTDTAQKVLDCLTTEAAWECVKKAGIEQDTAKYIVGRILYYLNKRAQNELHIECILYSNEWGLMGESEGARKMLEIAGEK